jgi:hypothetical protein
MTISPHPRPPGVACPHVRWYFAHPQLCAPKQHLEVDGYFGEACHKYVRTTAYYEGTNAVVGPILAPPVVRCGISPVRWKQEASGQICA